MGAHRVSDRGYIPFPEGPGRAADGDDGGMAGRLLFIRHDDRPMYLYRAVRQHDAKSLHQRTVELRSAYLRIEELAQTDELTGLPNRRSIVKMLDDEIARGHRGTPCSVAMIDIDWFKRINDGYGHAAGDEVLRTVAITVFATSGPMTGSAAMAARNFCWCCPTPAATRRGKSWSGCVR